MREYSKYDLLRDLLSELEDEHFRLFKLGYGAEEDVSGRMRGLSFAKQVVWRYLDELDESEVPACIRRVKADSNAS